jgi:DNA-binding transcriptional LysR family regulator
MLDSVSLDQLRTFIAAVDEGSFSAASRKLRRAQSVVSETVSNLEDQIGVLLFDRSGRYPKLTPAGIVLLADARSIVTGVDLLKARAKGMAIGLEPELSVVVDVFYPIRLPKSQKNLAKNIRVSLSVYTWKHLVPRFNWFLMVDAVSELLVRFRSSPTRSQTNTFP